MALMFGFRRGILLSLKPKTKSIQFIILSFTYSAYQQTLTRAYSVPVVLLGRVILVAVTCLGLYHVLGSVLSPHVS